MYNNILHIKFSNSAISLYELGLNEVAFDSHNVLNVISWCQENKYIILGGDVYEKIDSVINSTSDSWFYEPAYTESDPEIAANIARNYINSYVKNNGDRFLFSLIIGNKK